MAESDRHDTGVLGATVLMWTAVASNASLRWGSGERRSAKTGGVWEGCSPAHVGRVWGGAIFWFSGLEMASFGEF